MASSAPEPAANLGAEGKAGFKKYAAGLETHCPGGVYFNRDNSQLPPILAGAMPSKCGMDHSEARSSERSEKSAAEIEAVGHAEQRHKQTGAAEHGQCL